MVFPVAPHAGAWIEMMLSREFYHTVKLVAPHAGAWIEIIADATSLRICAVAPHAGAWIEIVYLQKRKEGMLSHPTRVRGLKCLIPEDKREYFCRTPRGCVD